MSPHLVSPLISIDGSHEKKEEEKTEGRKNTKGRARKNKSG